CTDPSSLPPPNRWASHRRTVPSRPSDRRIYYSISSRPFPVQTLEPPTASSYNQGPEDLLSALVRSGFCCPERTRTSTLRPRQDELEFVADVAHVRDGVPDRNAPRCTWKTGPTASEIHMTKMDTDRLGAVTVCLMT